MKNTYTLLSMLVCLLIGTQMHGQINKTLVKSFNLKGSQTVQIDLDGQLEIREWSQDYLRVQIEIEVENCSEAMLKSLIQAGRYNLYTQLEEGTTNLLAPGLEKQVKVGGQELVEKLSFIIFAPKGVQVAQKEEVMAASL